MGDDYSGRIWFDTSQAAGYTGYHRATILKALQSGELMGSQRVTGGRWRIHRDTLDAWLAPDSPIPVPPDSWGRTPGSARRR